MKSEPILCRGSELFAVLTDVRARGGFVTSMECGCGGHNANWRVSYFERVETSNPENPGDVSRLLNTVNGALNPSAATPAQEATCLSRSVVVDGTSAMSVACGDIGGSKPVVADGHGSATNFPVPVLADSQVCESPDEQDDGLATRNLAGCLGEARESTRTQSVEHTACCHGVAQDSRGGKSISIEERMAALAERLRESGRLKRSRTKTEARHPHNDP